MRDGGNGRKALYTGSNSNVSRCRQTDSSTYSLAARPRAVNHNDSRSRLSDAISPPPLKRQRTSSRYDSGTGNSGSTDPRKFPLPGSSALRHVFNGQIHPSSKERRREHSPEQSRHSLSFPTPPSDRERKRHNLSAASKHSYAASLKRSGSLVTSSKPVCRVCEKSSSTTYDPMIACPCCLRAYHDSCRKPRLGSSVDPQHWRCSTCLKAPSKRKSSGFSSIPTSAEQFVGRGITKASSAHKSSAAASSGHRKEVLLDKQTEPYAYRERNAGERLWDSRLSPNKPENDHSQSGPSLPKLLEHTMITNTPAQRSSQLDIPDRTHGAHHRPEPCLDDPDLGALPQAEECSSSMVLCSICRTRSIPAQTGNDHPRCCVCRSKTRIIGTWALDLPKTPDAVLHRNDPIQSSIELANSMGPTSVPTSATKAAAAARIESNIIPGEPNRRSKTASLSAEVHGPIEPVMSQQAAPAAKDPIRLSMPLQTKTTRSLRDDLLSPRSYIDCQRGGNSELILEKLTAMKACEPTRTSSPGLRMVRETKQSIPPRLSPSEKSMVCNDSHGPLDAVLAGADIQVQPSKDTSFIQEAQQKGNEGRVDEGGVIQESQHADAADDADWLITGTFEGSQPAPATRIPSDYPDTAQKPSYPQVSTTANLGSMAASEPAKAYTNRELAQIALVSANGSGMTASQIIDWVAQKFPYKQKGQGEWKKSMKSVLSLKPEFRSDKPLEAVPGSSKLYSFANAACRARFENEYEVYCVKSKFASKQLPAQFPQAQTGSTTQPTSTKVLTPKPSESSPSRRTQMSSPTVPDLGVSIKSGGTATKTTSNDDPLFNLFERPAARRSANMIDSSMETKRETSFHNLRLQPQRPSIETMTEEEKALKIAEIRARPSRKKFFGSDHRLAHVRRYGRQDIHNESDGAWKPSPAVQTEKKTVRGEEAVIKEGEDTRTLRELFNLPENAIPMNDGHELAFRDGTLVNGKLPRSRQIYRVGKMFGGELTTRLS